MLVAAKVDALAQTLQGAKHQVLLERRRVSPCLSCTVVTFRRLLGAVPLPR